MLFCFIMFDKYIHINNKRQLMGEEIISIDVLIDLRER